MKRSVFYSAALTVFMLTISRFLPHPPNFTPVLSVGLLTGALFPRKWLFSLIPLVSLCLGDLVFGFYAEMPFVYGSVLLSHGVGAFFLKDRRSYKSYALGSFFSSFIFYLLSNFGVWLLSGFYPLTAEGLWGCYVAAIPFFGWTCLGTLFYAVAAKFFFEYSFGFSKRYL